MSAGGLSPQEFVARLVAVQGALRGYILSHVPDLHAADDILQEVSVALWKKLDGYDPARPFVRWALGVAHKEILRSRRTARRSRLVLDPELSERLADRYAALEEELQGRRAALLRCIEKLPPESRRLVDSRYLEARPVREIAGHEGSSAGAVQMRLARIRAALSECIRRALGGPPSEARA